MKEKILPVFEKEFYHYGLRGPVLTRTIWESNGIVLHGFEYTNFDEKILRHILLENVEAHAQAGEEVNGNILNNNSSKASIFQIEFSRWMGDFDPTHLSECRHFQIIFYDEIYDVICKSLRFGTGKIKE